jgi:hypothetical protein
MRTTDLGSPPHALLEKLALLRTEFVDLAFRLERRGRLDAADLALAASARVGELCDEFDLSRPASRSREGKETPSRPALPSPRAHR